MDPDEFKAPQSPEQPPPSPDYVPSPEYLEYVAPYDDEIPVEDQPLHVDASPTALSPGYVADSDPLEEDPEEDLADYPADEGDDEEDEEESSEDDDDEEEDEASEEDEEEEEHLALTDSTAATPPPHKSPQTRSLFLRHIFYASAPTPPSLPPSPLSPLSSPLPRIPSPPLLLSPPHTSHTYSSAPLGYRATMIQLRAASPLPVLSPPLLLPSADRRSDILETDMSFRKRLCLTALASRVDYEFIDTLDASIRASWCRVMIAIEEAWSRLKDRSMDLEALIRAQEARTTALEAHNREFQRDVSVLQRQRIDDGDRLMMHIQHEHDKFRELARTRDTEHQDEPAEAGSSC
ncbi:hypothetical protein Tco_1101802 [Tanacetum coccineum]